MPKLNPLCIALVTALEIVCNVRSVDYIYLQLHLWDRHRRQPRRHTSQASSRQMTCTRVGAGRSWAPVRNCVLFLVSAVTARVLGPHQSESQRLTQPRQPGIRLQHLSQTGPDWLHEQSRFRLDVTEMGAEEKD